MNRITKSLKDFVKRKYPNNYFRIRNELLGLEPKPSQTELIFKRYEKQHKLWFKNAIPWYTLDSVNWLKNNIQPSFTVLELGAGKSTIWWLQNVDSLHTVEASPDWMLYVILELYDKPELMKKINLYFYPTDWNPYSSPTSKPYWNNNIDLLDANTILNMEKEYLHIIPNKDFDVIIFDGSIRDLTMLYVCNKFDLSDVKMVVVDNTEKAFCSIISDELLPEYFIRLDFVAGERDDIPKHQNGKHITSVFVNEAYYEVCNIPPNIQSKHIQMNVEERKKYQLDSMSLEDFNLTYKLLKNRLKEIKQLSN
jgi:hypothetical protein